jgi:hypothetical protein
MYNFIRKKEIKLPQEYIHKIERSLRHHSMVCSYIRGSMKQEEIFTKPSNYYYSYKKTGTSATSFIHETK